MKAFIYKERIRVSPVPKMEFTKPEQKIIEILRELKPFEVIRIVKDQNGRPDHYFVERTQKVVINS